MKVVLFCGGLGTRLREYSERIPKPLVEVGSRPVIWHLMRYYAHFGHKDFILCLGYGASQIKEYFLRYDETRSNDFVLSEGGRQIRLMKRDIEDWRITFVDTGVNSNIGQRLMKVREHLAGEELFMANYSDGLSDLDCAAHVKAFEASGKIACFLSVPLPQSFHIVQADAQNHATKLEAVAESAIRINGGFFVFRQEIFEYMQEGEELVLEPFQRLMAKRQLLAVPYQGFWRPMDTFKDKIQLDDMAAKGPGPWELWLR
jgi:glucose-1-phosphate cytidylyltransferase